MESQSERRGLDPVAVHALSNHLAVVLGFIELVISETPDEDPRKADLEDVFIDLMAGEQTPLEVAR